MASSVASMPPSSTYHSNGNGAGIAVAVAVAVAVAATAAGVIASMIGTAAPNATAPAARRRDTEKSSCSGRLTTPLSSSVPSTAVIALPNQSTPEASTEDGRSGSGTPPGSPGHVIPGG